MTINTSHADNSESPKPFFERLKSMASTPILSPRERQAQSDLRSLTSFVLKFGRAVLLGIALSLGAVISILTACTIWGTSTGNTRIISGAALGWLLFMACIYFYAELAEGISAWIQPFIERGEDIAHNLGNQIDAAITLTDLFRAKLSDKWKRRLNRATGIKEYFDNKISPFLPVILYILAILNVLFRRFCFLLIGASIVGARAIADIYLGLAGANYQRFLTAFSGAVTERDLYHWISFLIFGLAGWADLRHWLVSQRKQSREVMYAIAKPNKAGRIVMFFATFEYARLLYIFFCGLFGQQAFQAARNILEIPSTDQIAGIAILVPIKILSFKRQTSAFSLYLQLGPSIYWLMFGVLPLIVVLAYLIKRLKIMPKTMPEEPSKDAADPRGDNTSPTTPTTYASFRGAFWICSWLLLLSITVFARSGDLQKAIVGIYSHTLATVPQQHRLACLQSIPTRDMERLFVCEQKYAEESRAEMIASSQRATSLMRFNELDNWRKQEQLWARTVETDSNRIKRKTRNPLQAAVVVARYQAEIYEARKRQIDQVITNLENRK